MTGRLLFYWCLTQISHACDPIPILIQCQLIWINIRYSYMLFNYISPRLFSCPLAVMKVVFCVSVDTAAPCSNSSAPPFCSEHRSPDSLQTYFAEFQTFPWFPAWACHSLSPWQPFLSWYFIQHTFEERSKIVFSSLLSDCL